MVTINFLKSCFELGSELLDKNKLTKAETEFLKELDKITVKYAAAEKPCNINISFSGIDADSKVSAEEIAKKVKGMITKELRQESNRV